MSGQFPNPLAFRAAFQPLLEMRSRRPDLRRILYCSSTFSACRATPGQSVRDAIIGTGDRLYIGIVLGWLGKAGPFWEVDRFPQADDYFHFESSDVTDQGLGEAARTILGGSRSGVFSFVENTGRFEKTPLSVSHGLEEAPLGTVGVNNYWIATDLAGVAEAQVANWKGMVTVLPERFDLLTFAPNLLDHLDGQPFHSGISERVFALLHILQTLAEETRPDLSFTPVGIELWQQHTTGEKALFTDESEPNQRAFRNDLTFHDDATGSQVFCPWHGKIKINQFRIHFEWPRQEGKREFKIMYIGPKLTKN
jgi:hypothetical protein